MSSERAENAPSNDDYISDGATGTVTQEIRETKRAGGWIIKRAPPGH